MAAVADEKSLQYHKDTVWREIKAGIITNLTSVMSQTEQTRETDRGIEIDREIQKESL